MKPIYILIIAALMGLLSACISSAGIDPAIESTALDPALKEAITNELATIHRAQLSSIHFHQAVNDENNAYVLVSYQQTQGDGSSSNCEAIYEGRLVQSDWQVIGGGTTCQGFPIEETATINSAPSGPYIHDRLLYAYGQVQSPDARWVEITWSDDAMQRVPIVNGSYLTIRPDQSQPDTPDFVFPLEIRVLNALGQEIDSSSNQETTP